MHRALLATAKVNRHTPMKQINEAIDQCTEQLMKEYDTHGKIEGLEVTDYWDAQTKVRQFCHVDARRHAGSKVPVWELPKEEKAK